MMHILCLAVKLSTGVGRETDKGAVLFYKDNDWYKVCGDNFTDNTATAVCRELGFIDGQAQCCNLYGELNEYPLLGTHKVSNQFMVLLYFKKKHTSYVNYFTM